jgi:peptidoglycan/xylan/chitin deacetylase (PgdA/CDA1 family)
VPFRVALTFDAEHPDRPTRPGVAEELVALLASEGLRATFFVQGRWAEAYPATAARIAADGHLMGNHSHYHVRMPLLSDTGFDSDVRDAEQAIRTATGIDPRPLFRCPFGAGKDDPVIAGRLRDLGYGPSVGYDVVPEDWERTADEVATIAISESVRHGDGAVVLLHTWPTATLEAMPRILRELRVAGADLVRLDAIRPGAAFTTPTA